MLNERKCFSSVYVIITVVVYTVLIVVLLCICETAGGKNDPTNIWNKPFFESYFNKLHEIMLCFLNKLDFIHV